MFPIGASPLEPLKKVIQKASRPLVQEVGQSSDSLDLTALEALNQMEGPKVGRWGRLMWKLYGTGDKVPYPGNVTLKNFDPVDDTVYRGAMPLSGKAFEKLKNAYQITTIIDLRGPKTTPTQWIDFEKAWAKHHGLEYVPLPMRSDQAPTPTELKQLFDTIEGIKAKGGKVYVHCKHGIDRTGSVIGAYELKLGRPQAEVYARMKQHGYNLWHQLRRPAQGAFVKGDEVKRTIQAIGEQQPTNPVSEPNSTESTPTA